MNNPPEDRVQLLHQLRNYLSAERVERIHAVANQRTDWVRVVLEDTHYGQNAGAVVRSCDCFGVQFLDVVENESPFKVSRNVSKGSDKWVSIREFKETDQSNTPACLLDLKEQGYQLVATTPHQPDVLLPDFQISRKTAFLFGNERKGLSPEALALADLRMSIPIYGFAGSYNVSVSAALVLQQVIYQLHKTDLDWHLPKSLQIELEIEWIIKALGRRGRLIAERLGQVAP